MVTVTVPLGPQQDEEEASRDGHLGEVPEELALLEPDEGDDGVGEEVHLPH